MVALLVGAGCVGDLRDLLAVDGGTAAGDGRMGGDAAGGGGDGGGGGTDGPGPMRTTFASAIQADLDQLGCSSMACHGGTAPMRVTEKAKSAGELRANYDEVKPRASSGAMSLLLRKNLAGSPLGHAGGMQFKSTSDAYYVRWLEWINDGAPSGIDATDGGQ